MLQELRSFLKIDENETDLNRARFRALSRQLPLMYGILSINTLAVAFTHMDVAPVLQSVIMPVMVLLFAALRTINFLRVRHRSLTDEEVLRGLRQTLWLSFPTGLVICAWGLSFYQFGNDLQHAQIVFFIGVTLLTCAFCLMHLKQASILVTTTVTVITCSFLISLQSTVMLAVALNLGLVAVALCSLVLHSERDFARMVTQRRVQREQHNRLLALNEENERLANTDSLTGLANRRQFLAEIDACVEKHERTGQQFVVALMDLDGFKPINDVFGHPAGDQVLVDTAARLQKLFKGQPVTVARLGGDEFGLLIRNPGTDDNVLAIARMACASFDTPFTFDEGAANLSATVGMARFPTAANSRSLLFDRADYALYYAKQNAKSEPVFFSHEHERLIFANSALEQALRHADLDKEMRVEFQPVLDLGCGHTKGLEALARWSCPTLGRIRPDLFIKAAENIGMIGRLTEVLFRKAVDEARHWPGELTLSFNLSATSLTSEAPVMRLLSIADQLGFPTHRLIFEITESAVMNDFESAMEVLNLIRSSGAHVAIDDFGTGFSSLAYVHRLPIDILKIDRSFVRDLHANERSKNVLRSMLSLCENLNIACIVEGVETQEQFDLVCDLGGQLIQGYYYSKPLSSGDAHMVLQIEFDTMNRPPLRTVVNQ
ncbi:EAL domain-containing protein [Henriciella mobilis]|uniref:putative bifunctional diguanylate cyclase/phosphodiesterase n=1 Tax=Henriciella mobilis TaxID=2305467 RepID=UPI000E667E7D|nr:EAL domain-containing protein [Henriciella mobilis]RIJ14453.1 EAL domain-containing protein [Henriciella mobilis]RIJ19719.1 EAL domain-containing protein [Henriciella mobilis]